MTQPVLQVDHLSVALPNGADRPMALQHISLQLRAGETLCVVGESGSGKSVLATTVMGLLDGELTVASGSVRLQGESLLDASQARLRGLRGRAMGMVFQEPMTALNPVMRCGEQIDELLRTHTDWSAAQRREAVLEMLAQVRLPDPERMWNSYPHQLSGGQRQRIFIAMAMVMKPAPPWMSPPKKTSCSLFKHCSKKPAARCCSSPTTWAWWLTLQTKCW